MQILRRWRRLVAACAVILVAVAITPSPANAALWQLTDGFEGSPLSRWSFSGVGTHFGDFNGTNGVPRSGSKYAGMTQWDAGWSAVQRNVHLTPVVGRTASCAAGIWLQTSATTLDVNIEVIDPVTWTYIAVRRVTNTYNPIVWRQHTIGPWTATKADVVFRISLLYNGTPVTVKVDDVLIQCTYF